MTLEELKARAHSGHWSDEDWAAALHGALLQVRDFEKNLRRVVNSRCSCGGRGPSDPAACDWCDLWHRVRPVTEKR